MFCKYIMLLCWFIDTVSRPRNVSVVGKRRRAAGRLEGLNLKKERGRYLLWEILLV